MHARKVFSGMKFIIFDQKRQAHLLFQYILHISRELISNFNEIHP